MIQITDTIALNESEIHLEFIRASGPGGQNVNKVSSAVQLRFDAAGSSAIDDSIYERLKKIAGHRMTTAGVLIIKASRFRSQEQNRQDAVNRLVLLIRRAMQKPEHRRPTKPSAASRQRRLAAKRHRSEIKRRRKKIGRSEEETWQLIVQIIVDFKKEGFAPFGMLGSVQVVFQIWISSLDFLSLFITLLMWCQRSFLNSLNH